MSKAKFLSLGARDFIKGFLMAVLGAIFGLIQGIVNQGSFVFSWTDIWHAAFVAAIVYLGKNFFTNSQDKFLTAEPKQPPAQ